MIPCKVLVNIAYVTATATGNKSFCKRIRGSHPLLTGNNLVYKSIEFWIAISCDELYLLNEPCEKPSIQKPGNNFIQLQQLISFAPAIDNYARFNIRHK